MNFDQLTRDEFEKHLKAKTLRLAFIGMSNAGKSYRSRILQNELQFLWHNVDEEIRKSLGFTSMGEISQWLGYPNDTTYAEREQKYLDAEQAHTKIDFLDTHGKNLVFDTTGSVIYLDDSAIDWLKENCLLVHLDVGEHALGEMMKRFFEHPKPLIWHGFFDQSETEGEKEALARSYPKLLLDRLEKYRSMAHVSIPAEKFHDARGQEMLDIIKEYLP